jgi:hypothetical protein
LAVGRCSKGFEVTQCRQFDFGRVGSAIDVIGKTDRRAPLSPSFTNCFTASCSERISAIGAGFRLLSTDSEKGADAQRRDH